MVQFLPNGNNVERKVEEGAERIETLDDTIRRAQALVVRYVPKDVSLVDDLIAERRAAADHE